MVWLVAPALVIDGLSSGPRVLTDERIHRLLFKAPLPVSLPPNQLTQQAYAQSYTQTAKQKGSYPTAPIQHGMRVSAQVRATAPKAKLVAGHSEAGKQEDARTTNK